MSLVTKKNGKTMLSDAVYAFGKKLVQVILPALATLYFALAAIWHLPSPEQVVGTLAAVTTFLGVTLHLSSNQYDASGAAYDGTVHTVNTEQGTKVNFNVDPQDLVSKDSVTFKVIAPPPSSVSSQPTPPAS